MLKVAASEERAETKKNEQTQVTQHGKGKFVKGFTEASYLQQLRLVWPESTNGAECPTKRTSLFRQHRLDPISRLCECLPQTRVRLSGFKHGSFRMGSLHVAQGIIPYYKFQTKLRAKYTFQSKLRANTYARPDILDKKANVIV